MSKTEWKEYKLGDLCSKIGSGATPSGGKEAYKGGDFHLVRSQNVLDFGFSEDGLAQIDDNQAKKLDNVALELHDVLLNITGDSVARACIVPEWILPARVNQHVAILRAKPDKLDYHFLLYYLQLQKNLLLTLASGGATRNALTKQMIADLTIKIPPLAEQQRIAKILSSLDDKIELNNAINRNLEEQAQAIFKNWFIDFEPFGGEMPEDWKLGKLGDVAEIKKKAFHPEKNPGLIVEHYSLPALDEKYYPVFEVADGIKSNKFVVSKESVLISKLNPDSKRIWRPYCISENPICSTEFVVFESINGSHRDFLYSIIDSLQFYDFMGSLVTGCTNSHQRVSPETLLTFPIAIPPKTILKSFCDKITPIYEMIEKNVLENQRLTSLRDALLPKLMSKESTKN